MTVEFSFIIPARGNWSFSIFPSIILDNKEEEGTRTIEMMWLLWGIAITVYDDLIE